MIEFFAFFGIIFFVYGTFAIIVYLCNKSNNINQKKSLCDTCVYCIRKINRKDSTRYFASIKCPFRYAGDIEVDQHSGITNYCTSYKRRTDVSNKISVVPKSHPDFESDTLFLVNDDIMVRIEECDDGWDFSIYDPWSMKEHYGGQLNRPDMSKEDAIREIYQWYEL